MLNPRQIVVIALPSLAAILLILGALSLRVPVPTQEYEACLNATQNNHQQHTDCKSTETIFRESISDPVSYYSFWLTIFTLVLAVGGVGQWSLVRDQISLARDEFNATHRPRIILREVSMIDGNIIYMLSNVGDSDATFVESWILVERIFSEEIIRNLRSFGHDDLGRMKIPAGGIQDITLPSAVSESASFLFPDMNRLADPNNPKQTFVGLHFTGAILYRDNAGNMRRSVFRRRWDTETKGFRRMDDPDYEYAD